MWNLARVALSIGAAALFAGCGGPQTAISALARTNRNFDALPYQETFHYTGSEQSFTYLRA